MGAASGIPTGSEILALIQKMYTFEPPVITAPTPAGEISTEESTVVRSDQERARDIAQYLMALPLPTITPKQLEEVTNSWQDKLSIAQIGASAASLLPTIGLMESAIITTAVQEWAKTELDSTQLLQESLKKTDQNPLSLLLEKYVESNPSKPLAQIGMKQTLASLPILTSLLQTAKQEILEKAYLLSEAQLINSLLDKWGANEAKNAEISREANKQHELAQGQLKAELLANLVEKSQEGSVSPTVGAMVLFSCLFEPQALMLTTISGNTIVEICVAANLPELLANEVAMLGQGLSMASLMFAAPSAVSLLKLEGAHPSDKTESLVSAKAYCLSLLRMLEDPTVCSFIQSRLTSQVREGTVSKDLARQAYASFRSILLLNATVALYVQETGGATPEEIRAIIDGSMKLPEESLLRTMGKFIKLEMATLKDEERQALLSGGLEKLVDSRPSEGVVPPTKTLLSLWNSNYAPALNLATKG